MPTGYCQITGTLKRSSTPADDTPVGVSGLRMTVWEVVKDGVVVADGSLDYESGAGGAITFYVLRGSTAQIDGNAFGWKTKKWYTIPDQATYTLEELQSVTAPTSTSVSQSAFNAALAANSTADRARSNHTGTQTLATISDAGTAASKNTGTASGEVPLLGVGGKLPSSVLPAVALNDTYVVASQVAMLALSVETGDVAVRTDLNKSFILRGADPTVLADWQELLTPTDAVLSVNGQTGAVSLTKSDLGLGNVTNDAQAKADFSGYTEKTTPVDADTTIINDSAASGAVKRLSWANLKATLKTYFDTLYQAALTFTGTGDVVRATSPTVTTPRVVTSLLDANGSPMLTLSPAGSALGGVTLANAASGGTVSLAATPLAQAASSVAGVPLTVSAASAVAGSSVDGAAAGSNLLLQAGSAARRNSGNANGGNVTINTGAPAGGFSAGSLVIQIGGANAWVVNSNSHFLDASGSGGSPQMNKGVSSATVPAFSFISNTTSGMGLGAANSPSMIAAGTEVVRFTSTRTTFNLPANVKSYTVSTLPAGTEGDLARVTDGDASLAWGATVINSGGGATKYLVWHNGSNWTVVGK